MTVLTRAMPSRPAPFHPHRRWSVPVVVVLAHAALLWGLGRAQMTPPTPMASPALVIMASVTVERPAPVMARPQVPATAPKTEPRTRPRPTAVQQAAPAPSPAPLAQAYPLPVSTPALASENAPVVPAAAASPATAAAASPPAAPASARVQALAPPPLAQVTLPSSDAQYLQNPAPPYPRMSKRLGEQGTVTVRVRINTEGRAEEAEIRTSSGYPRLDASALETVKRWRYVPGKRNGVAETMWFNVPIRFVLD